MIEVTPAGSPGAALAEGELRRRLPPAERVPQILDAALAEFAERGYAGARMTAVASRAGVVKGLIYHYFPSKEALFRATFRASVGPILAEAERQVATASGSASERLRGFVGFGYARVCQAGRQRERQLFRLIITEAEHFPELARLYQAEVLGPAVAIMRAFLDAGVRSGEFRPEVAELPCLAEVLIAPAIMAAVWRMILGDSGAPAPSAMQAAQLELLLRGLAAGGGGPPF